jgi:hypothetical protein
MPRVNTEKHPLRSERIKVSVINENYLKLKKLSVSCDMSISELADHLLNICLNNVDLIQYLQNHFNKNSNYRVYPIKEDKKIIF